MPKIIRTKKTIIRFEAHNGNAAINLMVLGRKGQRPYNANLEYPLDKVNCKNVEMLCNSIDSIFPIGKYGKKNLKRCLDEAKHGV